MNIVASTGAQSDTAHGQLQNANLPLSFSPEPQEIIFSDYDVGNTYKQKFCLRNLYSTSCAVKVSLRKKSKYFRLESIKRVSKIAPGLEVQFFVHFQPDSPTQNYSNGIHISTEYGDLEVPIFASNSCDLQVQSRVESQGKTAKTGTLRQTMNTSTFSKTGHLLLQQNNIAKEIIWSRSAVKSQTSKEIYVRNNGKEDVHFDIMTEAPFFVEVTDELKLLGKKKAASTDSNEDIYPSTQSVTLKAGAGVQISLIFFPKIRYSSLTSVVRFQYKPSGDSEEIIVHASSEDVNCKLSTNNLRLPNTFIEKINQSTFRLINNSDTKLDFSWRSLPSAEDEELYIQDSVSIMDDDAYNHRYFKEENLMFINEAFTLSPLKGEVWPGTEFTFTVDFHPSTEGEYSDVVAWCEVSGRETRLPIAFSGLAYGPQIQFSYSSLDIGKAYINSKQSLEVYLENRGKVDAAFELIPSHSLFASAFNFSPNRGNIKAGDVQLIKIAFHPDLIGEFSETFQWRISGSSDIRQLHFSGDVVGPSFSFDTSEIDFGVVSYNFVTTKFLNLSNTSDIPMKFKLRIPTDGSLMGREFDIIPQSGSVLPHSSKQIRLDLLSNSIKEYRANLCLDIEDVGEDVMSLPIYASCIVPDIMLSSGSIYFGECFITYPYHQNLELTNSNNQPAKYEIVPPPENREKISFSIDNVKGVIPSNSNHKVRISLTCKTPGSHFLPLYVRILGSDRPPFEISVQATGIGPIITADVKKLDFGRISVLEDHNQYIVLTNKSPIPAKAKLSNKNGVFSVSPKEIDIEPESSSTVVVTANVDDALKFSDELTADIEKGEKVKIRLEASGRGSSLLPSISLKTIDFGNQFTKRPCQISFHIENRGRKAQQIQWQLPYKKKLGADGEGEPTIFKIIPDRAQIEPKSLQVFTVEGYSDEVGDFEQMLQCRIAREKENLYEVKLQCSFTLPLLRFSDKSLAFDYIHSTKRSPTVQSQPITIKNVSPIELEFTVKPSLDDAFSVQQSSYNIPAGESAILNVLFNPAYRDDMVSHNIKQKLIVTYAKHPQKDSIDLLASINYPNLMIESPEVDFGSVLNSNDKHKYVKIMNTSKAICNYSWCLDIPHDATVRYNEFFDIIPSEGSLQPGEVQNMQFIFRGAEEQSFAVDAICKVEGGPDYVLPLKAESSSISYSLSSKTVSFGNIAYDTVHSKEVIIYNKGKVPFQFNFDTHSDDSTSIQVTPSSGAVAGESSCPVAIQLFACIPSVIEKKIKLTVDNYNPEEILVKALSTYPSISMSLEKKESHDFSSALPIAAQAVENNDFLLQKLIQDTTDIEDGSIHLEKDLLTLTEAERIVYVNHLRNQPFTNKRLADAEEEQITLYKTKRSEKKDSIPAEPCVDSEYALSTYICDFGDVVKGLTKKVKFTVTNTGTLPVTLSFDKKQCSKQGFSMKPFLINQLPGFPTHESQTIEIQFNSKVKSAEIGLFSQIVPLRIHNGPIINIETRANIVLPTLQISSEELDFGRLFVSRVRFISVQLHNVQPTPCEFSIEHSSSSTDPVNFVVGTTSGVLQANEKKNIEVQFIPTEQRNFSAILQLKCAHNSKPQQIICKGEGKELDIRINPNVVDLPPVLPHATSVQKISLVNNSDIPVELFSLDFDSKYLEEQDILSRLSQENDAILIDPRNAGESLPQWLVDMSEKREDSEEEGEGSEPQNADVFSQATPQTSPAAQADIPRRKMFACVYGVPFAGKTTITKEIASSLGIGVVSVNEILSSEESEGLDEASLKKFLQEKIEYYSEDSTLYPNGFVVSEIEDGKLRALDTSEAILAGISKHTVYLIALSIDELESKIRYQSQQITQISEELQAISRRELNEDDFLALSQEEKAQYQKAIRSIRVLKKNLEHAQKLKESLLHHRGTINKDAEDIIPFLLEEQKKDQEQNKKPAAKGKSEPTVSPYQIHDTDDDITKRIKLFKQSFGKVFKLFQYPNGEPQEKGKKGAVQDSVELQRAFIFNSDNRVDDLLSSIFESITDLYPVEEEVAATDDTSLFTPPPYTKQILPLSLPKYERNRKNCFSLWEIKSVVVDKDPKAKGKGKKEEETVQEVRTEASRWIIPAKGSLDVWVQFSSQSLGTYHSTLSFGVVDRELQYTLACSGTVAYPQILTTPKSIFPQCVKDAKLSQKKLPTKKFFSSTNTYTFGPLLIQEDYATLSDPRYVETISLTNNGLFDAHVQLGVTDPSDNSNAFRFEPASLTMKPNETSKVSIKVEPTLVGDIKNTVVCCIRDNPIPFTFDIHAIGTSPSVEVDTPVVDFGKLLLTDKPVARKLTLTNTSTLPVVWRFDGLEKLASEFTITPTEGVLKYQGTEDITVIFKTDKPCMVNGSLTLKVSDESGTLHGVDKKIDLKSESYDLKIDMDTSLDLGTVKVVDVIKKGIKMENKGKYDVKYKWIIPSSLGKNFSVTPIEGILEGEEAAGGKKKPAKAPPKKGQADALEGAVQLTFQTNKTTKIKNSSAIKVLFFETEKEEKIGEVSFNMSVNAIYSKYVVTPLHGLNFGPLIHGKEKVKEFEISNPGSFDINFNIEEKSSGRSSVLQTSNQAAAASKAAPKKDAKSKQEPEGLKIGAFSISPKSGAISPGGKAVVKVAFNSDGQGLHREVVRITVPDTTPSEGYFDFDVQGESCVPGMNTTDLHSVFEEQQVVNSLSALGAGESAFAIDEQVFTFGTVTANSSVHESIRISNPFKVPCNISLAVLPRDKNDTTSMKVFEVQPTSLFIPPHEHRYAKVFFSPLGLQTYSAMFEALTKDGSDSNTNKLRFELRGEGSLPQISIEQPTAHDTANNLLLKFPRTLVGRSSTLPVVIRNDGMIAATYRFEAKISPSLDFPDRGVELKLAPGEVKSFSLKFTPTQAEKLNGELNLIVPDNHFDDTKIRIEAEGYTEDLTFENLPDGEFNIVKLGDCPVGKDKIVTYTIQNHSVDHMRFDWVSSDYIHIVPSFGHIHAKSQKEISISIRTNQPKEVKGEKIKLQTKKLRYIKDETPEWDDTHRTIRWIEVEDKPEPLIDPKTKKPVAGKKVEPQVNAEPPKMINKRIEEVDPEPKHEFIGQEVTRELTVEGRADYARFALSNIDNSICFAETQMFTQREYTFEMKNTGNVSLQYNWEFTEYEESAFSITPLKGSIEKNSSQAFTIVFSPLDASEHDENLVCHIANLEPSLKAPSIVLQGTSSCPVVHFELTPSDYISSGRRDPELPGPNGTFGELESSTRVVELESCGVRIKNTKRFFILNPTASSYKFQWKRVSSVDDTKMFECSSSKGIIHSGKKAEVCFEYTPDSLEVKECFWIFSIPERNIHVPFLTVGRANEPQLYFDQPRVNFKRVLVGSMAVGSIKLINREEIPFSYSLEKSKFTSPNDPQGPTLVSVSPSSGTIGAKQELTLEVKFKPSKEEFYNFNLLCKIKKKPNPLTCNIKGEGFSVHEQLEFGDSHQAIAVGKANNLDFGKVQINDKKMKTVVLYNNGDYNFDFSWKRLANSYLSIFPEAGTVEKRGKVVCTFTFHPTRTVALNNYKATCKVTNGGEYTIVASGHGVQPKIDFSFRSYDFGPRFLHHQGAHPNECILKVTNNDERDISYDIEFENTPYLEVEGSSIMLKPGDSSKVKCLFKPREYKKYSETIVFHVNGLYKIPITVEGEGTPAKIELTSDNAKNASFGALRVGESSSQTLTLLNKSKIPTTIEFPRSQEQLSKNFVSIDIKEAVTLEPKEKLSVNVIFHPLARLQSFSEHLIALIEGKEQKICSVSGSCQGVEVKLNPQNVSFGMVVQNTTVTQKVVLENNGDIGINFGWNKKNIRPDLTISPMQGYIPPNEDLVLDVTFAPTKIKSVKYENIECKVEQFPSVFMTVTGTCVNKPEQKETLSFSCPVRQKDAKTITIENPSKETWMLRPTIDSSCWSGDDFLEIAPSSKATYTITYSPVQLSKQKSDEGTLFFPLPNGDALLYSLQGKAGDPLPLGDLSIKMNAKSQQTQSVVITNWLSLAQRFHLTFDFDKIQSPDYIKGVSYLDVPARGKKTYKFMVEIFKPGQFSGRIVFTNKETGEYCFYNCKFDVGSADAIETLVFETPVRQSLTKTISVENPLNEEVPMVVVCTSPEISVPKELLLPPKATGKLEISYLPLVANKELQDVKLTLQSEKLGEYPYVLTLHALPASAEKNIHFSVPLGGSQLQTIRFKNLCRVATEYAINFEEKDQQIFTLVDKPLIKSPPADSSLGNEVSFDVVFEPGQLGKFKSKINISSKQGGDFSFLLFGHCTPPKPQGPIEIAPNGTSQISFKNVLGDAKTKTDFKIYVDNPAFSVKPETLSAAGKSKNNVAVSFKPVKVGEVAHGKLIIEKKDDSKLKWTYYLLGLVQAPAKSK